MVAAGLGVQPMGMGMGILELFYIKNGQIEILKTMQNFLTSNLTLRFFRTVISSIAMLRVTN